MLAYPSGRSAEAMGGPLRGVGTRAEPGHTQTLQRKYLFKKKIRVTLRSGARFTEQPMQLKGAQ
jgi:hypothetical protein